jgi:prepilin peptidase CpaA
MPALTLPLGVVLAAVLVTAATDLWQFKVRNLVTLPLLAAGILYHALVGGSAGFAYSALGALSGFAVLISLYILGGMGGGDVKLFAAIGAWLGLPLILYVFIASSLAAGAYALAIILLYRTHGATWTNLRILWHRLVTFGRYLGCDDEMETAVARADRRGRLIPFAAMIALGTLATLVWISLWGAP